MAVKIQSVKEAAEDTGVKILVHGPAGSGKTTLCVTTGEPTLLISAEAGLLSIKNAPDYIHTAVVESIKDIGELFDGLYDGSIMYEEGVPYRWIALDSLTEIGEQVLTHAKKMSNDPRKSYPQYQSDMIEMVKMFRDLRGYNVIMTCKQQRVKDESTGVTTYEPTMPGNKLGPELPYLFDEVFALRVEKDDEGEDYHIIQTKRDIRYEAKDRSGKLDLFEKPNLKKIVSKIHSEE